jgi:hypothetical protein
MFYCAVPFLHYLITRFRMLPMIVTLYIASIIYKASLTLTQHPQLAQQLPGQLSFFFGGALFFYRKAWFLKRIHWLLLPCLLLFAVEHTLSVEIFRCSLNSGPPGTSPTASTSFTFPCCNGW